MSCSAGRSGPTEHRARDGRMARRAVLLPGRHRRRTLHRAVTDLADVPRGDGHRRCATSRPAPRGTPTRPRPGHGRGGRARLSVSCAASSGARSAGEHDPAAGDHRSRRNASPRPGASRSCSLVRAASAPEHARRAVRGVPRAAAATCAWPAERWPDLLFPPAAFDPDEQASAGGPAHATPGSPSLRSGIAGLAVSRPAWPRSGWSPTCAPGTATASWPRCAAAGAFDPATLLGLSEERAAAIVSAAGDDPGTMAAVSGTADEVAAALAGRRGHAGQPQRTRPGRHLRYHHRRGGRP